MFSIKLYDKFSIQVICVILWFVQIAMSGNKTNKRLTRL